MGFLHISSRDMSCWAAALAVHCLLFLWQASEFRLPELALDPIVSVDFLEQDPYAGLAQQVVQDSGPAASKTFMSTIKSLLGLGKDAATKKTMPNQDRLAGADVSAQIAANRKDMNEPAQPTLKDRQGRIAKAVVVPDTLATRAQKLSAGTNDTMAMAESTRDAQDQSEEQLQDKEYRIASKELPFELSSRGNQEVALVGDRVYVPTGKKTSAAVSRVSSRVAQDLAGGSGGGDGLIDRGAAGGGLSGAASGSSIGGRVSAMSQGGGTLMGAGGAGSGSTGGTGAGSSSTRGRGRIGSAAGAVGELAAASSGRQAISEGARGSSDTGAGSGRKALFEITGQLAGRKIIQKKIPAYPDWASKEGIKAVVGLYFEVLSNGTVKDTVVVQRTSGYPRLDRLASKALVDWLFEPLSAAEYGKIQWGVITFRFDIR